MAGTKKSGFKTNILSLLFQNINIPNIGDAGGLRGSVVPGVFYIALYTVSPSATTQGTECDYTGYARVAVTRSSAGWVMVGDDNIHNAVEIAFGLNTLGTNQVVAYTINIGSVIGVDDAIYWAELVAPLSVSPGITPSFAIGDLDIFED
jgi:hypothetical protein